MRSTLILLLLQFSLFSDAQIRGGVFVGGASYLGDLNTQPFKRTKPAVGFSLHYELSTRLSLRGNLMFGSVEGGDKWSGNEFNKLNRNLSFRSAVTEASLMGEFNVFNLENIRWSPYGFAGIAVFRFDPYVKEGTTKIYLQRLFTEGQSLTVAGPSYRRTEFAVPVGGGIKFNVNESIRLAFEAGLRRTFTDYLDDVSTTYPDAALLLAARGQQAVDYAYRGDEVPGGSPGFPDAGFPSKGTVRGTPNWKDFYYFTGLHLTFAIGGGYAKNSGGGKGNYGCPMVRL